MFRPPPAERVTIPGPAGELEALIEAPDAAIDAFAVICHPHPLHGGTLDNKVVHTVARAFQELGVATVRFNFRGVGKSAGRFAEGEGESEDASAIIEWGRERWRDAALWLGGFSFGGAIAIRIAAATRPSLLVTVSPAVQRVDPRAVARAPIPWLIVQGDADDVVRCAEVKAWAAEFAPAAELVVVEGVGHFFHGRLHELRETVIAFASRVKKSPAGS
jgi:uncharacterized protein